jgi:hypothetical protein
MEHINPKWVTQDLASENAELLMGAAGFKG